MASKGKDAGGTKHDAEANGVGQSQVPTPTPEKRFKSEFWPHTHAEQRSPQFLGIGNNRAQRGGERDRECCSRVFFPTVLE